MTRNKKQTIKTVLKYTTLIGIGIGLTIMVNKIIDNNQTVDVNEI